MRRRHYDYIGRWISYFQHDAWLFRFLFWCIKISCTISQCVWRRRRCWCGHLHRHHSSDRFSTGIRCHWLVPISVRGLIMWMLLNWNVRCRCRCIDDCRHCIVIAECGEFICIRWLGIRLHKFTTANTSFKQWITEIMYTYEMGTLY